MLVNCGPVLVNCGPVLVTPLWCGELCLAIELHGAIRSATAYI